MTLLDNLQLKSVCHVFFKHNKDERAAKSICGYLGHSRTAHERSRVRDTEHNVQSENTEVSLQFLIILLFRKNVSLFIH